MAISVSEWVWKHSRSRHAARLVMLAIAWRINEQQPDGWCWPTNAELMSMTGLKERAVQTAVTELARSGELVVEYNKGRRGSNRYRIVRGSTPAKSAPPQNLRGAESAGDARGTSAQASKQDPANFAPPAKSAPPQNPAPAPANFAPGTGREQEVENSPTESSLGGAGGGALFDDPAPAKPRRSRRREPASDEDFERWYAAYPVHKAPGDAQKAWREVTRAGADPEILIAAAKRYADDPQVARGFGKYPAGWLRARCWLDEPAPGANGSSGGHRPFQNPTDPDAYKGTL